MLIAANRAAHRRVAGILATVTVMAAIAYIGFQAWNNARGTKYEIHSIAVMPFANLSGDPQQEYFADGMTEELISDLGQVSALRVISRTSVMTYKGTKKTMPEIAHELGVDGVVEASVLREGKEVRITAQLINARTDRHIWARSYTRNLTSVLALQGEVAQEIANAVKVALTTDQKTRLARERPVNAEAQDLYLRGKHSLDAVNPRDASGYFQKALALDPDYAQAHAALADSYSWLGDSGIMAYSEAHTNQKAEAVKAIELDEALPEGHVELAKAAEILDWDWVTEETELKRALELNPNNASIHWAYCFYLGKIGRIPQARDEMQLALELDPVSARMFVNSGLAYYSARQYDQALAQVKRVEGLDPDYDIRNFDVHFRLGVIYAEKGMYDQAIKEFLKIGDHPHALGHMGHTYARAGRIAEARATIPKLQEHIRKDGIGAYEIALVYTGLGEKDEAFKWLEKAYAARDKGLTYLKVDPCFDPLRSDPRFQDLLRRVGLPL